MTLLISLNKTTKIWFLCVILLNVAGIICLMEKSCRAMAQVNKISSDSVPTSIKSFYSNNTPAIDGQIGGKEWNDANKVNTSLRMVETDGTSQGSHPFTLYIKNDDKNLYMAIKLENEEHDGTMDGEDFSSLIMDSFTILFDNNDDGLLQSGEDKKSLYIINGVSLVMDAHHLSPEDQAKGMQQESESQDITGAIKHTTMGKSGDYLIEIKIPISSGDSQDIIKKPGDKVRWNVIYTDKFSVTLRDTSIGGLFGVNIDQSDGWGYLVLARRGETAASEQAKNVIRPAPPFLTDAEKGDIRLFAMIVNEKDLSDSNLNFIGSHYDVVLLAYPFKHVANKLRAQNPDITLLLFNNPYFAFGDKFWTAPHGTKQEDIAGNWSLKTNDGKNIYYSGPSYPGFEFDQSKARMLDIRNSEWQKYYAQQSRKYVDFGGLDGLFIDTLGEDIPLFALGPGRSFPKEYSAQKWKSSGYELLNEVKKAFSGTSAKIFFNGISRPPDSVSNPNMSMVDVVYGTAIEAFGIYLPMDDSIKTKEWFFFKTIMTDMKLIVNKGKSLLVEAYANSEEESNRLYALASFLLLQNNRTYFHYSLMKRAGANEWFPEWSVKLGPPAGSYKKDVSGVYYRKFEKAFVYVNPYSSEKTFSITRSYKDLSGRSIEKSMTLKPFSGAILLFN